MLVVVEVVDVALRRGVRGIMMVGRTLGPLDATEGDDDSGDEAIVGKPVLDGTRR